MKIKPTVDRLKEIAATIPISYYLGANIPIKFERGTDSYYDPNSYQIVIGMELISEVLSGVEFPEGTDEEEMLRDLVYHELSHVILTPKTLGRNRTSNQFTILNIFEDERIETIDAHLFMKTDFKKLVRAINDANEQDPFWKLVRLREGPEEFIKRVEQLIEKYSISKDSLNEVMTDYENEIFKLYEDFMKETKSTQSSSSGKSQQGDGEGSEGQGGESKGSGEAKAAKSITIDLGDGDEGQQSSTGSVKIDKDTKINVKDSGRKNEEGKRPEKSTGSIEMTEEAAENIKAAIAEALAAQARALFKAEGEKMKRVSEIIESILDQQIAKRKRESGAISAYSGVFNPRMVTREDKKFFVHKNRLGSNKEFSKYHLNLFIDVSGSFRYNQTKVNEMLEALERIERKNPDFSFDLVTISMREVLKPKNDRRIDCYGGNDISDKIYEIYRKLQLTQTTNYNIVLFDGDAFTDAYGDKRARECRPGGHFSCWSGNNCVIISSTDNKRYLENNSRCKIILTPDYTNVFIDKVYEALRSFNR